MLFGDFNTEVSETYFSSFLLQINAKNIVNNYTCYKSVENPNKDKNNNKFKNESVKAFHNVHLQYYIFSTICIL